MEELHRDPRVAIAAVENVLIVAWLGSPVLSSAQALERTTRILAARHRGGIAHLNVVAQSSTPTSFGEDARKVIVGMLHDRSLGMVGSVTVFGGGGFVAATIRGVLASLTMLSRIPAKIRFVATMDEAIRFLETELAAARAPMPDAHALKSAAAALLAPPG